MYTLFSLPPAWGLPSSSPFCIKLEAYLRWRRIPYRVDCRLPGTLPLGKVPALGREDGEVWPDSRLIIARLEEIHPDGLDAGRPAAELARLRAAACLAEDSLVWTIQYFRWKDRQASKAALAAWAPQWSGLQRAWALRGIKARQRADLIAHGVGRLNADDAFVLGKSDLRALAELVTTAPYLGGQRPATADASVYGALASLLYADIESPLKAYAQSLGPLTAYTRSIRKELFSASSPAAEPR